jgi:hypothetical protein
MNYILCGYLATTTQGERDGSTVGPVCALVKGCDLLLFRYIC